MKQDYSSPFYNIKNNPLLRNCYIEKGKKPLNLEELKECVIETYRNTTVPELFEPSEKKINDRFDFLAKKIKFDDDEKVPMDEFIRLFCTHRN